MWKLKINAPNIMLEHFDTFNSHYLNISFSVENFYIYLASNFSCVLNSFIKFYF